MNRTQVAQALKDWRTIAGTVIVSASGVWYAVVYAAEKIEQIEKVPHLERLANEQAELNRQMAIVIKMLHPEVPASLVPSPTPEPTP